MLLLFSAWQKCNCESSHWLEVVNGTLGAGLSLEWSGAAPSLQLSSAGGEAGLGILPTPLSDPQILHTQRSEVKTLLPPGRGHREALF